MAISDTKIRSTQ